jgi:hypothetical protein
MVFWSSSDILGAAFFIMVRYWPKCYDRLQP